MMKTVTVSTLQNLKQEGEKFSCLTAYDATFANQVSHAGVEVILVGDSLGMVLQGHDSTLPVSVDDMVYHVSCVQRGNQGSLIMADLPFMSYSSEPQGLETAARLMQAGAHMVKLEGGAWLSGLIEQLVRYGIPVCAHLGLTPQTVNQLGGYKVQGREPTQAEQILRDCKALERAGASVLLLECVPAELGRQVAASVEVPVIGIGAGPDTDGQVLVLHDMLGITPGRPARFVKNFMAEADTISAAIAAYHTAVKHGTFPASEHCF